MATNARSAPRSAATRVARAQRGAAQSAPAAPRAKTQKVNGVLASAQPPAAVVKAERVKLLRDSFTIPAAEYELIGHIKQRAVALMRPAKKSEVLRAGLKVLAALDDRALRIALDAVPA